MRKLLAIALLALCAAAPARGEDADATTIFLVAQSKLRDPNFGGSVVVVLNNIGPAPAGLIVNRPTRLKVARLFPDLESLEQREDKVYFGGPVQVTSAVSFLFRSEVEPDNAARVLDGVYLSSDRKLLRKLLARDEPMEGLRIFVGYSGWSRGQLEAEVARGDWTLAPADAETLFGNASERPWPDSGRDVQATSYRGAR